jgi:hypothetical protein
MMRILLFFVLISLSSIPAIAQRMRNYSEIGPSIGMSYYMGDLNPGTPFFMSKLAGGLSFRYNYHPRWAWRLQANYLRIAASDSESENPFQKARNLSFQSNVFEFAPTIEFNFFPYEIGNSYYPATPYVFFGMALYRFNPKAEYKGELRTLRDLSTEGQGVPGIGRAEYNLLGLTFPFGFGFKAHLAKWLGISLEWGLRKTFTDYLDDVSTSYVDPFLLFKTYGVESVQMADRSGKPPVNANISRQRGNPNNKDWYGYANLTICIKLNKAEDICQAYK